MPKTNISDTTKLFEGFFRVADAVSVSMGKEGKLAAIEEFMAMPTVTKDGVTIARKIQFGDDEKEEAIGGNLLKTASIKSLIECGDGTSTAACLAAGIVRSTYRFNRFFFLGGKGEYFFNKKVEKGMQAAFEEVIQGLETLSSTVTDSDLEKIASISANNDSEIGNMIFRAYQSVGKDGIISVREGAVTDLNVSKGMRFNKGFISPFLINNQKNATYEAENALILVYNGFEINNDDTVKDWINSNKKSPIVIIAEKIPSEDWIRDIYRINTQGGFNITLVEAPNYDVKREALLEDIALYVGGEVFVQGASKKVVPGKANQVIVEQNFTSLIKDDVSEEVTNKINDLKAQLETTSDKEFIKERIQGLSGVSATIIVGGATEGEVRELKDRFDDAVAAVKSAVESGWIAGGGSTLCFISDAMSDRFVNQDEQYGYDSFKKAIQAPFRQIALNARRNPDNFIHHSFNYYGKGYNAHTDEVSDLVKDGVIDSCKSTKISLANAFSVAKLLLNIKVVITQ